MPKHGVRLSIGSDGSLMVEDPSPLEIAILKRLGIKLSENDRSNYYNNLSPKYRLLKDYQIPLSLFQRNNKPLNLHNEEVKKALSVETAEFDYGCNLFDLKRSLLKKFIKRCCLCGYRCKGKKAVNGECPMGKPSYYHQHFIHTGEEREIGRTLVIELIGCNMRCKFCQKGELIEPKDASVSLFTPALWDDLKKEYYQGGFSNISFLGGNPDQSLLSVLDFLEQSPGWASQLPIVWHTNGYSSPEVYMLLWGLVDIWVFDFKYFNNDCALAMSKAVDYNNVAKSALETICKTDTSSPVIVRHLLLPGHWHCCQRPLIEYLSRHFKGRLIFNPMGQYIPLWEITSEDKAPLTSPLPSGEMVSVRGMNRRLNKKEMRQVLEYAYQSGLITSENDNNCQISYQNSIFIPDYLVNKFTERR